jgi:hypothetical protein
MIGRREFSALGLSAAALAALQATGLGQDRPKRSANAPRHDEHNEAFQECAEACSDCQRACDTCATHCAHLMHAGEGEHVTTLMTCQDCADICACASQCCARGGPFVGLICEASAEACSKCAEECEKFPDDKHMAACAKECRKCERACRGMLKHADHGHHHEEEEGTEG